MNFDDNSHENECDDNDKDDDDDDSDDDDLAQARRSQGEERGSSVSTQKVKRRSFFACDLNDDCIFCLPPEEVFQYLTVKIKGLVIKTMIITTTFLPAIHKARKFVQYLMFKMKGLIL